MDRTPKAFFVVSSSDSNCVLQVSILNTCGLEEETQTQAPSMSCLPKRSASLPIISQQHFLPFAVSSIQCMPQRLQSRITCRGAAAWKINGRGASWMFIYCPFRLFRPRLPRRRTVQRGLSYILQASRSSLLHSISARPRNVPILESDRRTLCAFLL